MCGIAGVVGGDSLDGHRLSRGIDLLQHRGPDGSAFLTVRGDGTLDEWAGTLPGRLPPGTIAGFGHCRLSILDRTPASDQPFVDHARGLALVYNGEIYNFVELRTELEAKGHRFRSDGDTEVLLAAYAEWGTECTRHLVGMWAFAILDVTNRQVVLSRDRFGVKPLYVSAAQGGLIFASEIKAIAAMSTSRLEPNPDVVGRFVVDGKSDEGTATFFQGVENLAPGSTMVVDLDSPTTTRVETYWELGTDTFKGTEDEAVERVRSLFDRSVHEHLRSDVATGTCLSGGLDSSSIVCTISHDQGGDRFRRPLLAFGFCSEDDGVSERPFMEAVAAETDVELVPVTLRGADVQSAIAAFLEHHDEPVGSASALAQWAVFDRVKAEGVTVVLDGQGADEIFGGYHSYYAARIGDLLRQGRVGKARQLVRTFTAETGDRPPMGAATMGALMAPVLRSRASYARALAYRVLGRGSRPRLLESRLRSRYLRELRRQRHDFTFKGRLRDDLLSARLPSLLRYEDSNSMAFSIEARVPFLDHRLVDFAATLPDDLLLRGVETKYILRKAMSERVPQVVLDRTDKVGFRSTPRWTTEFVTARLPDLLSHRNEYEQEWLDPTLVEAALRSAADSTDAEFLAWRLANLIVWLRKFN